MTVAKNKVVRHIDTGRIMKVVKPRGFVCDVREPKGRTKTVSTAKLMRSSLSIDEFRQWD